MELANANAEDIRRKYGVTPVAGGAEPRKSETLLSLYAKEDEIAAVRDWQRQIADAKANVDRIESALGNTFRVIQEVRHKHVDNASRAAARALGEALPTPEPRASLAELEDEERGLLRRLTAAKAEVENLTGKFRSACCDLLAVCQGRCVEEFIAVTKRQAWFHQQIDLANQLLPQHMRLVDDTVWTRYCVPASHREIFRPHSREENFVPLLASADRLALTQEKAKSELLKAAVKLLGEWPL